MLDDIDYSDLTAAQPKVPPASEPKKKSNISERSVVKPSQKTTRKPVDVEAIAGKAEEMQTDVGAPEIPDPLAQYGLPALGALGALGTAYGVYKSLQNKNPPPPPPPPPPPGPNYNAYNSPAYLRNAPVPPNAPVVAAPSAAPIQPSLPQQTNLTPQDLEARAAQLKAPVAPGVPPGVAKLDAENAAQLEAALAALKPVSTPITAAPVDAPAPMPTAGPNSPVTSIVTDTVKEMIQETPAQPEAAKPVAPPQELRTGTGKPAFAGMGPAVALNKKGQPKFKSEYADINAVPRDYAFVPGADKIDTLRNTLGQQAYTEAFTNRPFPSTNEMAMQQASEINRMLGRPTRAELIAAGLTPAANTPGITQLTNPPKGSGLGTKTAKVGGVLGALIAIPDLAKAETPGQRGMAGANLLEAILPPGFMMGGAGEGSGSVPSVDAAMLLGSPYAQSPLAVKRRQEQEYVRKVGAGRGIAPPSAYQR